MNNHKLCVRIAKTVICGKAVTQVKVWVDELYALGRGDVQRPCHEAWMNGHTDTISDDAITQIWTQFANEFYIYNDDGDGEDYAPFTWDAFKAAMLKHPAVGNRGMCIPDNAEWVEIA